MQARSRLLWTSVWLGVNYTDNYLMTSKADASEPTGGERMVGEGKASPVRAAE